MMDPGERSDRQSRWFVFWMLLMILGVCSMVIALILFALEHPASATKHWSSDMIAPMIAPSLAVQLRAVQLLALMVFGLFGATGSVVLGALVLAHRLASRRHGWRV
jgi:hypothetical protein